MASCVFNDGDIIRHDVFLRDRSGNITVQNVFIDNLTGEIIPPTDGRLQNLVFCDAASGTTQPLGCCEVLVADPVQICTYLAGYDPRVHGATIYGVDVDGSPLPLTNAPYVFTGLSNSDRIGLVIQLANDMDELGYATSTVLADTRIPTFAFRVTNVESGTQIVISASTQDVVVQQTGDCYTLSGSTAYAVQRYTDGSLIGVNLQDNEDIVFEIDPSWEPISSDPNIQDILAAIAPVTDLLGVQNQLTRELIDAISVTTSGATSPITTVRPICVQGLSGGTIEAAFAIVTYNNGVETDRYLEDISGNTLIGYSVVPCGDAQTISLSGEDSIEISTSGKTDSNVFSVTIYNAGNSDGTITTSNANTITLERGDKVFYSGYYNPVTKTMELVDEIEYDATGTTFKILIKY